MHKIDRRYCQSCGMPLKFGAENLLGTNADNSKNEEFCFYCLKDGEYTVDYSMQQMVDVWVKYTEKYNGYCDTGYTPEQLKNILSKRLPTLKRWKQKKQTENIHNKSINLILSYVNRHLFEELDKDKLADMAGMSFYHFRRVFRNVTGENIGTYIQRLRLEYIAYQLIASEKDIKEIIESTNYQNKHSFSKAFKKHFGLSPYEYRKQNKLTGIAEEEKITLCESFRIEKLQKKKAVCILVGDSYTNTGKYMNTWDTLVNFAHKNELVNENKYLSISLDDPIITSREQCRFYLGITIEKDIEIQNKFTIIDIPDGIYAIFRINGDYSLLPELYQYIYMNWLPENNYRQKEPLTFEVYINTPKDVEASELITEVYIPIEKIDKK